MEAITEQRSYFRSRNPRACDACRTTKSRCFASEQPNICQKCLRSGLTCFVRAIARPGRAKSRNLIVHEPNQGNLQCNEESENFCMKLETIPFVDRDGCLAALEQRHQDIFNLLLSPTPQDDLPTSSRTSAQLPQSQRPVVAEVEHVAKTQVLTIDDAEKLLQYFYGKRSYFPFVVLPENATVKSLSRNSPFLLLAILTAASAADIQLNHQLDYQFKRVLGEKVILEGQKSLDFLQGLLVYNAWYPSHLRPRNRQTVMYLNLAISLADDLGLGQRHENSPNLCAENVSNDGLYTANDFSRAAKRAYLGCYYLSSSISMVFQKQNALKYKDLIDEYGCSLAVDPEIPSDLALLPLVRSCDIRERILALNNQQRSINTFQKSAFAIDMEIQAFHDEIEDWKMCLPDDLKSLPLMLLTERYLFMIVFSQNLSSIRPISSQASQQYCPLRLSKCLEANKKYFETLLSIQAIQYQGFTYVQWCQMVHAIIILSRLSSPIPTCPSWDMHTAREYAPLGMFLDCLCYRMQGLSSSATTVPTSKNPDGPFIFRMLLESVKKAYEQRIAAMPPTSVNRQASSSYAGSETATVNPPGRLQCPMMDQDLVPLLEPIQAAFKPVGSGPTEHITIYHDLWATMTMSWSAD